MYLLFFTSCKYTFVYFIIVIIRVIISTAKRPFCLYIFRFCKSTDDKHPWIINECLHPNPRLSIYQPSLDPWVTLIVVVVIHLRLISYILLDLFFSIPAYLYYRSQCLSLRRRKWPLNRLTGPRYQNTKVFIAATHNFVSNLSGL